MPEPYAADDLHFRIRAALVDLGDAEGKSVLVSDAVRTLGASPKDIAATVVYLHQTNMITAVENGYTFLTDYGFQLTVAERQLHEALLDDNGQDIRYDFMKALSEKSGKDRNWISGDGLLYDLKLSFKHGTDGFYMMMGLIQERDAIEFAQKLAVEKTKVGSIRSGREIAAWLSSASAHIGSHIAKINTIKTEIADIHKRFTVTTSTASITNHYEGSQFINAGDNAHIQAITGNNNTTNVITQSGTRNKLSNSANAEKSPEKEQKEPHGFLALFWQTGRKKIAIALVALLVAGIGGITGIINSKTERKPDAAQSENHPSGDPTTLSPDSQKALDRVLREAHRLSTTPATQTHP